MGGPQNVTNYNNYSLLSDIWFSISLLSDWLTQNNMHTSPTEFCIRCNFEQKLHLLT